MSNKIFVDTNVIIDLIANKNQAHVNKLKQLMNDANIELYINNLVLSEVLQGIELQATSKYDKHKQFLMESFNVIIVDNQIILDSIEVYRTCKANGVNFNNETICPVANCKRILYNSIDCMHYATCVNYKLTMLTNDKLFDKIDEVFHNKIILPILTTN